MNNTEAILKAVAELREARARATQGEWKIMGVDSHVMGTSLEEAIKLGIPHSQWTHNMSVENTKFVIKSANRITALCDALEVCVEAMKQHEELVCYDTKTPAELKWPFKEALTKAAETLK